MRYFFKILFILIILIPGVSFAAEKSLTEDRGIKTISIDSKDIEGKLKAGVILGYPWGITVGYRFSNFFELNGVIGSDYDNFTMGINGLFTLINLKIYNETFPFSVGPTVYSHFGHHDGDHNYYNKHNHDSDEEYTKMDLLGIARLEYSFKKIPLNLFIEGGFGLQVYKFADTAGSFGIGVRYIF